MKKVCLFLLITLPFSLSAFEAGGGVSVFVPQSLYQYGSGSVSLEQSLEFELGLTKLFSLPMGLTYNTNYGLMVKGEDKAKSPWFYSDSLMPYLMLKVHIPFGPFFVNFFGGGAANYNFTLRALEGNIEKDLSVSGSQAVFTDGSLDFEKSWGFGYLAGAGMGVKIDKISIELSALFRSISHELNLSADYDSISQVSPGGSYDPGDPVKLLMQGISIGLSGSLAF